MRADEAATAWENLARDVPALTGISQHPARDVRPAVPTPPSGGTTGAPATGAPSSGATKKAGREAFTLDDETASC